MEGLTTVTSEFEALAQQYEHADPASILRKAYEMYEPLTFACSFGAEDVVLLDIIHSVHPDAQMFYLDTDLFFPETYTLRDQLIERYRLNRLTQVRPALTLQEQAHLHGDRLWESTPDVCCNLRKVNPLSSHLGAYRGWITGIRREQAPTRANAQVFEWDHKFAMVKVNPLVKWTSDQVWEYIRDRQIPYNPLHDQGYPSIGCAPCTRAVQAGEDPRSGRWANHGKTECGLHK